MIPLHLSHSVPTAVTPSPRVLEVAAMFGLGIDTTRTIAVVPPIGVELAPGRILFITGPSGGGKSTILRLIEEALRNRDDARAIRLDAMPPLPDGPIVDAFDLPTDRVLALLSLVGLGDAFVMLRRPCELSDGQRARLRLAQAIHVASEVGREALPVILADEFGATLDRATAAAVARNLRRWTRKAHACVVAATTHDDLLEALEPDVLIEKHLGDRVEISTRFAV